MEDNRKIVRTSRAGVFFATVDALDGSTAHLSNARRIWYWDGAASLSQLAMSGTSKPANCKFPEPVGRVVVFDVIEILDTTPEARASIDGVAIWKK